MPTTPQPPARPAPQQQPAPRPANAPPAQPVNRPQGAATREPGAPPTGRETVGPAQTYPPGSRYRDRAEARQDGPDPQESKLRPYELTASLAQEEPVLTAAQEQRARSEDMQEEGVERRKARLDERDPRARPRTVAGVSPTQIDAD
jgi:hypothetical protein